MNFLELQKNIENCMECKEKFGFKPHPVFWGCSKSKIMQISQAPSSTVHDSLKPFSDLSGKTLKYEWYQISDEEFYDTKNFFIGAMAHCYPGKDSRGNDKAPPKICFDKWILKEVEMVDNIIYIIIGAKAAKAFFPDKDFEKLVFNNQILNGKLAIVLPHPSPLNRKWLRDHPLFMTERIVEVRKIVHGVINEEKLNLYSGSDFCE